MPQENEEYDPKQRIAYLEKRLAEGEAYLAKNPNNPKALAGYWRYWEEHTRLATAEEIRAELNYVTLALPANTAYQPESSEDKFDTVRVCFLGKPEKAGDISAEQLREIVESVKLVSSARQGGVICDRTMTTQG